MSGADVRLGAGERLPFTDGIFDAVLAQLVVQLMDDRDAGVREMARVARPGGTVAACVWDSGRMPLLRSFWDAALEAAPERAAAIDDGRRVGYEGPGSWERCSSRAGSPTSPLASCSSPPTTRASTTSGDHSPRASATPAPAARPSTTQDGRYLPRMYTADWGRPPIPSGSPRARGGHGV